MKQFVSLFLIIAMVFTFSPVYADNYNVGSTGFSDVDTDDYYAQAAETLRQLNILSGYPDGSFRPDKGITRAEMAAVVCRILDEENKKVKSAEKNFFTDVLPTHWAAEYIGLAASENIISGDGRGHFRPNDLVKYEEAVKMIVCASGLDNNIETDTADWAEGYLKKADESGILNGVKGIRGEASTRADIAVMVYNALATENEDARIPATPSSSLKSGEYNGTQRVKLTTVSKGAEIYYTLDGTTPNLKSTKYMAEILINKKCTLKAVSVLNGVISKNVMTAEYNIRPYTSGSSGSGSNSSKSDTETPGTEKYTVKFDIGYNDASEVLTDQIVGKGERVIEPEVPERRGYFFEGWYIDKEYSSLFDFQTQVTSNTVLYAKWTEISDDDILNTAYELLNIIYASGDRADCITKNISLPLEIDIDRDGKTDVNVTWKSNKPETVSVNGVVERPKDADISVSLTAELHFADKIKKKVFECTVIKINEKSADMIADHNKVSDLKEYNGGKQPTVHYDQNKKFINVIDGTYSDVKVYCADDAILSLNSIKSILKIKSPGEEFKACTSTNDEYGASFVLSQKLGGYEVYGRRITVSTDSSGNVTYLTTNYQPYRSVQNSISISEEDAISSLKTKYEENTVNFENKGIVIYSSDEYEDKPVYVYKIEVSSLQYNDDNNNTALVAEIVFVDAETGNFIDSESNICLDTSVRGEGTDELGNMRFFDIEKINNYYYMHDIKRNIFMYKKDVTKLIKERFNVWLDKTAVSAYRNVIDTRDWFERHLNRISMDGNNMALRTVVHKSGKERDNAYYLKSEKTLNFCDNSNSNSHSAAACKDVTAHEYTHGVLDHVTGGIPYKNATGAIDEAYADIFGCLIENNWIIGENWKVKGLRNIADPLSRGTPMKYGGDYWKSYTMNPSNANDNGGVHINSTVLSHAAYLMSKSGIDNTTLEKLWYKSMQLGYNSNSQFIDVRLNVVKAAKLLGLTDVQIIHINNAFENVNIRADFSVYFEIGSDGRMYDGSHPDLDNADATIKGITNSIQRSGKTGFDGELLFTGLYAGKYEITVTKEGYMPLIIPLDLGEKPHTRYNQVLTKKISEENGNNGFIYGVAQASNGSGIEGLTINVRDGKDNESGTIVYTVKTESFGRYWTNALPAGDYTIQILDERDSTGKKLSEKFVNVKIYDSSVTFYITNCSWKI